MKKPTQKNQQTSDPEKLSNLETSNPEKSSNLLPRKIIKPTWKNQTQKFKTIQHPQGKKKTQVRKRVIRLVLFPTLLVAKRT